MYIRLFKSWSRRNYRLDDYLQAYIKKKKKKKKNIVSPTLSVSAVVNFYSVSTVHFKARKNKQMSTLQTKTRPNVKIHIIYSISNANCMRKNVCPFQYPLSLMLSYST